MAAPSTATHATADAGTSRPVRGRLCIQSYTLGLGHGAVYLAVLLVLAVVLSVLSFRRRDVP
jgi:hypothetical protein